MASTNDRLGLYLMHRFKNILFCPLGKKHNAAAVKRVADLAHLNKARLTLFGVVPEPSLLLRLVHRTGRDPRRQDAARDELTSQLIRWRTLANADATTKVTEAADRAIALVVEVLIGDHDLVVVTSDEDRDQATIRQLLRKCPCPVWVIRPTRARIQRVLAAVNPDPAEASLNHTILELAASMNELYGGELHVGHAWELYGEGTMRSSVMMHIPPGEIDELLDEERDRHRRALQGLLASSKTAEAPWQTHLEKGRPGEIIPALVAKHRINLLVVGTVAKAGIAGLVIGNTAEQVLDEVGCSVVALKPSTFVSPVHPPISTPEPISTHD